MFYPLLYCVVVGFGEGFRRIENAHARLIASTMSMTAHEQTPTCVNRGCNARLNKTANCQCNPSCIKFKDCCHDYFAKCCPQVHKNDKPHKPTAYVYQHASCMKELPLQNKTLQVSAPTQADLEHIDKYLIIYLYNGSYSKIAVSNKHKELCYSLFPESKPMVWPSKTNSNPVCVLAATLNKGVQPIFWSDYNKARGIPNFVAYLNRGMAKSKSISSRSKWKSLPGFKDKIYGPSAVKVTRNSHCNLKPDCACGEKVSSRGHMATYSHMYWDSKSAGATNTYVNTVPVRQPFDGAQWNAREIKNLKYAQSNGPLFVVKGPSLESDGVTSNGQVEVPSMLWTAVYDPRKKQAIGWIFRNGYEQPKAFNSSLGLPTVGCFGADDILVENMEKVVGLKFWPGVTNKVEKLSNWKTS